MNGLAIAITCVGYSDYLELTLPHTLSSLGRPTIVTAPSDHETIRCSERHGVTVHVTDAWYRDGRPFDKAGGLNSWLDSLESQNAAWILTLDADIVVPPNLLSDLEGLDRNCLYGVQRRVCERQSDWNDFVNGVRDWTSFEFDLPTVRGGKLWGLHETTNTAAVYGYFQLWHAASEFGAKRFVPSPTAALYDVLFALTFGDSHRSNLLHKEVLHLGPIRANWSGRISEIWSDAARLPVDRTSFGDEGASPSDGLDDPRS